jgi:hypothetical protein
MAPALHLASRRPQFKTLVVVARMALKAHLPLPMAAHSHRYRARLLSGENPTSGS